MPALLSVYLPLVWQHIATLCHRTCPQMTMLFAWNGSDLVFAAANCEHCFFFFVLQSLDGRRFGKVPAQTVDLTRLITISTAERREKVVLYFGGVRKVFARCWVDLLAARPTKSSPHIHFVFFIFFVSHSHFLSAFQTLSFPADWTDCCQLVKQQPC